MTKTTPGNFFEDFRLGQTIAHATPRTDHRPATSRSTTRSTAARFAVSPPAFCSAIGYPRSPVDDLLGVHIVFGKTVPDISLNAVANLGYADCRFLHAVYPGDTLTAVSEVIGLKENSSRKTGVVYVRSAGFSRTAPRCSNTCAG
jgi:2-methylfumaryl-CoA hydratase